MPVTIHDHWVDSVYAPGAPTAAVRPWARGPVSNPRTVAPARPVMVSLYKNPRPTHTAQMAIVRNLRAFQAIPRLTQQLQQRLQQSPPLRRLAARVRGLY